MSKNMSITGLQAFVRNAAATSNSASRASDLPRVSTRGVVPSVEETPLVKVSSRVSPDTSGSHEPNPGGVVANQTSVADAPTAVAAATSPALTSAAAALTQLEASLAKARTELSEVVTLAIELARKLELDKVVAKLSAAAAALNPAPVEPGAVTTDPPQPASGGADPADPTGDVNETAANKKKEE